MGHHHSSTARMMCRAHPWCSNSQLFEGILWLLRSRVGWPDLQTHTLARQRVGLDDIVGKKTGVGYGV